MKHPKQHLHEQVDQLRKAGLSVIEACAGLGVSKSWYYQASKTPDKASKKGEDKTIGDAGIVARIGAIKSAHPFWGYRRVWAWLRHREHLFINKKRVYRLMRAHDLLVPQNPKRACRSPRSKPKADRPLQYWGIDMTKFMIPSVGWVYLVIVLDWYTKKIVGHHLSLRARRQEWEAALDQALQLEFPTGVRGKHLKLISDNGSQPTSVKFIENMALLDIEQIFTSYNNPKGNAETERMMRTIKEEVLWLQEFDSFEQARQKVDYWITHDYNQLYPHSVLNYKSPNEFIQHIQIKNRAA
ncbi:MAG: IS3 family transposase [Candidatus Latescibacterota bacterium]